MILSDEFMAYAVPDILLCMAIHPDLMLANMVWNGETWLVRPLAMQCRGSLGHDGDHYYTLNGVMYRWRNER